MVHRGEETCWVKLDQQTVLLDIGQYVYEKKQKTSFCTLSMYSRLHTPGQMPPHDRFSLSTSQVSATSYCRGRDHVHRLSRSRIYHIESFAPSAMTTRHLVRYLFVESICQTWWREIARRLTKHVNLVDNVRMLQSRWM
jgi:hypothetical protein